MKYLFANSFCRMISMVCVVLYTTALASGDELAQEILDAALKEMASLKRFSVKWKEKGIECQVSKNTTQTGITVCVEQMLSFPRRIILTESTAFEVYPKENIAIDIGFKILKIRDYIRELTEFDIPGASVSIEENSKGYWVVMLVSDKRKETLMIDKQSGRVNVKRIFGSESNEVLRVLEYGSFDSSEDDLDSHDLPPTCKVVSVKDDSEYAPIFADIVRRSVPQLERSRKRIEPLKRDPETGRLILEAPPGISKEAFAEMVSKNISSIPTPQGLRKEDVETLAEKWKTNTDLKEVLIEKPIGENKVGRSAYGSRLLLLIVAILFTLIGGVVWKHFGTANSAKNNQ